MRIVGSLLRKAGDDAFYTHIHQVFDISFFVFETFVRGSDDDEISVSYGCIFNAAQDGREEMRHDVGHDDSDDAGRVFPQAHGEHCPLVPAKRWE